MFFYSYAMTRHHHLKNKCQSGDTHTHSLVRNTNQTTSRNVITKLITYVKQFHSCRWRWISRYTLGKTGHLQYQTDWLFEGGIGTEVDECLALLHWEHSVQWRPSMCQLWLMIRKDIRVENSAWLVSFNICWKIVNLNKQYDNMVFEASPDKKQLNAHNKFTCKNCCVHGWWTWNNVGTPTIICSFSICFIYY